MNGRLYRSSRDRMIAGVAGGLAAQLGIDPSLVRIVWAVLVPVTGFLALLVYIVMAIVVPTDEDLEQTQGWTTADPARWGTAPGDGPGDGTEATATGPAAMGPAATGAMPPFGEPGVPPGAPAPPPGPQAWHQPSTPAAGFATPPGRPPGGAPAGGPPGDAPGGAPGPAAPPPFGTRDAWRTQRPPRPDARRTSRGPGSASVVVGGLLILTGVWFLVREYLPDIDPSRFWPLAIIALGVVLVLVAVVDRARDRGGRRR